MRRIASGGFRMDKLSFEYRSKGTGEMRHASNRGGRHFRQKEKVQRHQGMSVAGRSKKQHRGWQPQREP